MSAVISRLTTALADRYRVDRELGAGGMATVYLAHDLKHERDVAIKVLHPDLGAALGADRFLSEIKTTAKLQHPHILPLLDSGAADGLLYYVMPFVRGETLRARLEREKQLPIEDALRVAREVASALEHAHKQGIIHRDIKPENILLQDGAAVVADFGIALAVQSAAGARMTQTGLSLGTPQYMSPEQAMGERTLDARSDIYALGAVTYEMLAGEPPFSGPSTQAIVAKVLTERPTSLRTVRDTVPEQIDDGILRALAKLPADRFASATSFAAEMTLTRTRSSTASSELKSTTRPTRAGPTRQVSVVAMAVLVVTSIILTAAATRYVAGRATEAVDAAGTTRFLVEPRSGERFSGWIAPLHTASPDGKTLVYSTEPVKGGPRLIRRAFNSVDVAAIAGSEGATTPAFAPDGNFIAFAAPGGIYSVSASGGNRFLVVSMDWARGIAWVTPDAIVFGRDSSRTLFHVSPVGGMPVGFGAVPDGWSAWWPVAIRGTSTVLFSASSPRGDTVRMYSAAIGDQRAEPVVGGEDGVSALGVLEDQLLYVNASGDVLAAPFDLSSRRITGAAVRLGDNVGAIPLTVARGLSRGSLSPSGDLMYLDVDGRSQLMSADGSGHIDPVLPDTLDVRDARIAPDGNLVAMTVRDPQTRRLAISLFDRRRGILSRLTPGDAVADHVDPRWTSDGKSVVYRVSDNVRPYAAMRAVDGSTPERVIRRGGEAVYEVALAPDNETVLARVGRALAGGQQLATWSLLDTTQRVFPFMAARFRFSPDGRWIASFERGGGGVPHLVVRAFPGPGAVLQIDRDGVGDSEPVWSRDGKSVYYTTATGLAKASLQFAPALAVTGTTKLLNGVEITDVFDLAPDGSVLFLKRLSGERLTIVRNVMAEVRALRASKVGR